jgi:hypothetical protein
MINIDIHPVEDEAEALTLMRYHLRMAERYFEATPKHYPAGFFHEEHSRVAIFAWLREMEALYPED